MVIIGEKINSSRKKVEEALKKRDSSYLISLAQKQKEAGADFIDVNCGTLFSEEKECMEWLVKTIQETMEVSLCIDSPSPEVLETGFQLHKGKAFLNSITGEKERVEKILPVIKKFHPFIIVLCMDEKGAPAEAQGRVEIARKVTEILTSHGVKEEDIFFDPIIRPISTESDAGRIALETISKIKEEIPGVKTVCGLSNVSYGLPLRPLLNATFLAMAMGKGLDGAILDPTEPRIQDVLCAGGALRGEDTYCLNYISAFRDGKLGKQWTK
ncbi:methyltetrahydrofolate cobalamin methyltransferase [Candidatus Calescamantes bacterium]|nr:methyltetrahydrofolate cobalamin methyltransferase [Candidatus Calescamantes bacterium]